MKKMSKKVSLLLLTISCGCLGTSLLNAALTEEINAKVESTKEWQIDSSENNRATFEGQGAIEVNTGIEESISQYNKIFYVTGANVTFVDGTADDAKKNALLTLDFQNEPSVDIRDYEGNPITKGVGYNGNTLVDLTDENGEPIFAKAHIFAKAVREGDNSVRVSSTAVDMTKGGKLEVTAADGKQPVLAAYSYKNNNNYNGNFDSAVIRTSTGGGNNITVSKPSKLLAFVSHPSGYGTSSSAVAVIGVSESNESDITTEGSNRYNIGNDNNFAAYSAGGHSGAVVLGVATGNSKANAGGSDIYKIGSNNAFTVSTYSGTGYCASAVIGAASGGWSDEASIGDGNSYIISDYNTFSAASFSGDHSSGFSSAVVIGASGRDGAKIGDVNRYEIGTDGNGGNRFIALSGSFISSYGDTQYSFSAVIGTATQYNSGVGENNTYTIRGNENEFLSYSHNGSQYSGAVVIGATTCYGGSIIKKGSSYNIFGNDNKFLSYSRLRGGSSNYAVSAVFGAASIYSNASVEGGSNYNMSGSGNIFSSFATSYDFSSSPWSAATVIGAVVVCDSNANIEGNSVYEIGAHNTLTATSSSSSSFSSFSSGVVIGASAGRASGSSNASVSGSQEITINSENILSSLSEATSARNKIYSATGIFGAACTGKFNSGNLLDEAASTARGMSINLNGSQTISALTGAFGKNLKDGGNQYNDADYEGFCHGIETVNVFGADDTDKREDVLGDGGDVTTPGDKYGWRVGIYNEEETPAVVNILGAKLAEQVVFAEKDGATARDAGTATVVLSADQGSSYQDYARAFALGKDFQIYIGGKSRIKTNPETKEVYVPSEGESQFEVAGSGTSNVVNIFGAISPAQYAANTISTDENNETVNQLAIIDNTKLVVDNNWTANTFAPVEGLENISITGGGKLQTFGDVKCIGEITIGDINSAGEMVVYKNATIGKTTLGNGAVKIGACTDNGTVTALNGMASKMKLGNPSDNGKLCDVSSLDSTEYVKNFGTTGALTLDGEVTFKVDTSKQDNNVGSKSDAGVMTKKFQLVKGYIELEKAINGEATICGKLELGDGGKFVIDDESTSTIDPENRALMFVRAPGLNVAQMLGDQFMGKFTAVADIPGLYALNSGANLLADTGLIVGKVNVYAKDGIGIGLMNEEYARMVNTVDGGLNTPGMIIKRPLDIIVKTPEGEKTPEGSDRIWALYGDAEGGDNDISTNKVTFIDETKDGVTTLGSISVYKENASVVAADITFDEDVLTAENVSVLKEKSLLTMRFENEPTIDVAVNKLDDELKPTGETEDVGLAHIYAHAKNGDAVALHIADGVNVKFTGDTSETGLYKLETEANLANQKRVGIFSYSESENQDHAAVGIVLDGKTGDPSTPNFEEDTGYDQVVTFAVPTKIYIKSEVVRSSRDVYSAAAAIGRVCAKGSMLLNGSIKYDIGDNNEFLAAATSSTSTSYSDYSSSYSSGVVIGASAGHADEYSRVSVSGNSWYAIGDNNTLSATSASSDAAASSYSSGVVIGASVGRAYRYNSINVSGNNVYEIGSNNTLNAFSSSINYSSVAIVGVSVGFADDYSKVSVDGNNEYEIGNYNILRAFSFTDFYSSGVIIGASAGLVRNYESYVMINGNNKYKIGSNNILSTTITSKYPSGVIIGASAGYADHSNINVKGDNIYEIGNNNTLSATSYYYSRSDRSPYSSTAIIGASVGCAYSSKVSVSGNSVYEIGNNNTLSSTFFSSSPYSSSSGVVIGASAGYADESSRVSVSEDSVYEIGNYNTLSAISSSSSSSSWSSYSSGVVIGASAGEAGRSVSVSGNSVYKIGNYNTLSATSSSSSSSRSSSSSVVVIGASAGCAGYRNSNVSVSGSQEITINNKNRLSSLSIVTSTKNGIYSAAGVFGAACSGKSNYGNLLDEAACTARGMSINLNGSQTISALTGAFGNNLKEGGNENNNDDYTIPCHGLEKVSVFGADDTDKREDVLGDDGVVTTPGDKYGWRVGIYNEEETPATVNILGAKLAEKVVFTEKDGATARDAGTATVVLSADQGNSYQDYARAFALGKDFQIYIGGKSRIKTDPTTKEVYVPGEGESQFEVAGSGTGNVVNIFGAIAPAQYAANTISMDGETEVKQLAIIDNTKLVIDNNWTANTFAPVEGLEKFTIKHGAVVNAFDRIQKIGSLRLKGGTLNLKNGGRERLENALSSMTDAQSATQLTLTHKIENGDESNKSGNYAVESIGLADDYESNENRFAKGGKLTLGAGEVLRFYVNSDLPASQKGEAVLADGYITVESGLKDALDFAEDSKIELVNVGTQPIENEERKFILIRGEGMTVEELLGADDFNDENLTKLDADKKIWAIDPAKISKWPGNFEDSDDEEGGIEGQSRSGTSGNLARMMRALVAPLADEPDVDENDLHVWFEETEDNHAQMILARKMTLLGDAEVPSLPGIGSSSAQINTAVVSMFRNAINPRLAGASSRGDGAFIYGIGGHVHQSSIAGIGYGGDLYGIAAGADKLLNYKDGYIRLGAMIGYIYGDVDFHGSAIGKKQKSKQDNYLCALYCAYGSINEKNLKTDLNLSCGFGYTKHRLNRVDQKDFGYNAKMKSNNFFLSAEFIKNLYAVQGIQFGLWLKADYNHIHQKAYSEHGGAGAQSISKAKFDFLDTTIGVNIEKEIQNSTNLDRSLRLYMKAGWNCQPMRSHSTIVAGVNGKDSVVSPHFGSHNSAVFTAGLRQKLNARWDLIGEWNGSFNKKHSNNLVTLGAGYTF